MGSVEDECVIKCARGIRTRNQGIQFPNNFLLDWTFPSPVTSHTFGALHMGGDRQVSTPQALPRKNHVGSGNTGLARDCHSVFDATGFPTLITFPPTITDCVTFDESPALTVELQRCTHAIKDLCG